MIIGINRVSLGLEGVRHLRVHGIFGPFFPIIKATARFVDIDGLMLVNFEAGKEEINAANGHFFHPALFVIDRNAQSIVNGALIECYDSLPDDHFVRG